ncbi:hypothetical protein OHA72_29220 [Dactylosporangium sp. NBC_01737]|uniref:hypothetical protein n=1 Tax=Dactylosporangium sp. NBC_01737 TaxID=2975959 RepID=UPI002E0D8871|nr:hypothetical protein OHA72_29220 [Dactylosporangium sp. NBC_01737]
MKVSWRDRANRVTAAGPRSVAVGGDVAGIVSTGDHATFLPAEAFRPAAAVDAPAALTNLPVRPGSSSAGPPNWTA